MNTEFDKTKDFNILIKPKILELIQLCNKERIPIFVSACVKNDEKESTYVSDMFAAKSNDINLHDDKLIDFVNVTNGFVTIPKSQSLEIDYD